MIILTKKEIYEIRNLLENSQLVYRIHGYKGEKYFTKYIDLLNQVLFQEKNNDERQE